MTSRGFVKNLDLAEIAGGAHLPKIIKWFYTQTTTECIKGANHNNTHTLYPKIAA